MDTYEGTVEGGSKSASDLGYPTANIALHDSTAGIFAAYVHVGRQKHAAVVYADHKRKLLEAHLLDFSGDLYGKKISIELLKKVREPLEFRDDKEARERIAADVRDVRAYFKA